MAVETREARLVLPAAGTAPATLEVEFQPKGERTTRTILILVATVVLAPVVIFIPPHILWPPAVLITGLYFARKVWTGEYVVQQFEGKCPRCGEPLEVEPGTRIRGRQRLECFNCHREPELVLDGDDG